MVQNDVEGRFGTANVPFADARSSAFEIAHPLPPTAGAAMTMVALPTIASLLPSGENFGDEHPAAVTKCSSS